MTSCHSRGGGVLASGTYSEYKHTQKRSYTRASPEAHASHEISRNVLVSHAQKDAHIVPLFLACVVVGGHGVSMQPSLSLLMCSFENKHVCSVVLYIRVVQRFPPEWVRDVKVHLLPDTGSTCRLSKRFPKECMSTAGAGMD